MESIRQHTPIAVDFRAEVRKVRWCDLTRVSLQRPFFQDAVGDALAGDDATVVETGCDALQRMAESVHTVGPHGVVFHSGRCGSTLVANALGCRRGSEVFKEPQSINQALLTGDLSDSGREWTAALIRCLLRPRGPAHRRSFIKFSSWNVIYGSVLRDLVPAVPVAFVYRDPMETMVSMLERRPGWIRALIDGVLRMPDGTPVVADLCGGPIPVLAQVLGRFYQSALELPGATLINYVALSLPVVAQLCDRWSGPATAADHAALIQTLGTYSKGTGEGFVPDGARKRDQATPAIAAAVERFARPAYEALERRRTGCEGAQSARSGEPLLQTHAAKQPAVDQRLRDAQRVARSAPG